MPAYEYRYEACQEEFTLIMSFSERENAKVTCPKCGSYKVKQLVSTFTSRTSRKS